MKSHVGQRLANGAKGVAHCAATDHRLAGRYFSVAVAMGKDLKKRYGVVGIDVGWVKGQGVAEGFPNGPSGVIGICSGS
jgi:hypothetical protein